MDSHKRFTFGGSGSRADKVNKISTTHWGLDDGRKTPESAGAKATSGRNIGQSGAGRRPNFAYPLRTLAGEGQSVAERKQEYDGSTTEPRDQEHSQGAVDQPPPYDDGLNPVSAGLAGSFVGQARTRSPSPHALFPDVPPPETLGTHPSMRSGSDRSIYIGYDPSSSTAGRTSAASSNVIPNFSAPNPRLSKAEPSDSRRSGPPPSRWPVSSIYSQNVTMVSPIPEESGSSRIPSREDREFYASGTEVSPNWVAGPADFDDAIDAAMEEWDNYGRAIDDGEETGLVRQASLGRKSKATIVHNGGHSAARSQSGIIGDVRHIVELRETGKKGQDAEVSSAASSVIMSGSPKIVHIRGNSSISSKSSSPLSSVKNAATLETLDPEKSIVRKGGYRKKSDTRLSLALAKELGYQASAESYEDPLESPTDPSISSGSGRRGFFRTGRLPTRLDIAAVRDAEARGSLTSLPDLIRRATRLAAQLDMGARPASRAWSGGSFMEFRSSRSMKDSESLSDILASFPPPVHRHNGRSSRLAWPLPDGDDVELGEKDGNNDPPQQKRRICGLPLWAIILLGILLAMVIVAAIVLPVTLIKKDDGIDHRLSTDPDYRAELLEQCEATSTCQNGGVSVAGIRECSCVCINGFTGVDCEIAGPDPACTIANYGEPGFNYDFYKGVENATIGKALPDSLWASDRPAYNLPFDVPTLLGEFSKSNVSCTSQNALITFGGHSSIGDQGNFIESSLQWGRYAVLYVAQELGMEVAGEVHTALDDAYAEGKLQGDVVIGEVTVHLGKNRITMPGGEVVGSELPEYSLKRMGRRWLRWTR